MIEKVSETTKGRILNAHYYMPPANMMVELMTDGYTHPEILPFLAERHKEAGLVPFIARKESSGLIFNRAWAAVKREFLTIMAEGVSTPEELDQMWKLFFQAKQAPCRFMDGKSFLFAAFARKSTNDITEVGLDTVQHIEEHYIKERGLSKESKEKTVDFLEDNYIKPGKLGNKSDKGGLYPPGYTHDALV